MNRYLAAKQLNIKDELVWYKSRKGQLLKCKWKKLSNNQIAFFAITMDREPKVFKIYTRYI